MIELRDYQKQVVDKILWAKNKGLEGNDLVVLPTGAGKSIVIASLAAQLNEPILILQPSKEILEQNYNKLRQYVDDFEIGIYSASMKEKRIAKFTFATIGSIYKAPEYFRHFKLIIIDECHLVNPKNLGGMFMTFLNAIGKPKVIGLTATPYRMDLGYRREETPWGYDLVAFTTTKLINRMKGFFWQRLLFNINIQQLIDQDYLCPLQYHDRSVIDHADIPLNKSRSEFDMEAYEQKLTDKQTQILLVVKHTMAISKSVLVFCASVSQAENYANLVEGAAVVTAKTPAKERDKIISDFKTFKIPIVFNVGVLTTGFDHPALDCIILLRPTRSIGLYYQMIGRGVRKSPGKTHCKVVDMTSTVKYLGRVETIRLERQDKWELLSDTGSWHGRELYSFKIKPKVKETEEEEQKDERRN